MAVIPRKVAFFSVKTVINKHTTFKKSISNKFERTILSGIRSQKSKIKKLSSSRERGWRRQGSYGQRLQLRGKLFSIIGCYMVHGTSRSDNNAILLHCDSATILHCYFATLLICYTATTLHCYYATLPLRYTATLLHCYSVAVLHCYTATV